jgi:hypothetical protein
VQYVPPPPLVPPPPPPGVPRPPIDSSRVRPGRWGYWLAGAIFVATVILVVLGVLFVIDRVPAGVHRFVAPGTVTQRLHRGDERTIYVHLRAAFDDNRERELAAGIPDPACRVIGPAEQKVALGHSSGTTTITTGGDTYEARLEFEADRAGRFRVTCRPRDEAVRAQVLGIGRRERLFGFVGGIFGTIGVAFLGLAATVVAAALTGFLRYRSRRRLEREPVAGVSPPNF